MVASGRTPAQSRGVSAIHIWLIVFVALWLVSTVLAVLLYTGREELLNAASSAEDDAKKYMRSNEKSRFQMWLDQAGDKRSLARVLDNERVDLAHLVGVNDTTTAAGAKSLVNGTIADLAKGAPEEAELPDLVNADLLTVVKALQSTWMAQAQAAAAERKRLAAANRRLDELTARQVADAKEFEKSLAERDELMKKLEADKAAAIEQKNRQIKSLEQRISKSEDAYEEQLVRRRNELRLAQKEAADIRKELKRTQEQLTEFRPKVASIGLATQADGKVIRARSDEDIVYLDLGQKDHLVLGLRFQIFSASAEVDPGGEGKATVEVVGINPTTSECRVIESTAANPIVAGDLAVNVVYDPKHKYRFVVEGRFDIDGDGRSDPQDVDRIKAWIRAWGGEVVALPASLGKSSGAGANVGLESVDFVVLGTPPPMAPKQKDQAKPEERARNEALRRAHDRFLAIKQEAKDLALAVLTQSQFLHFIGHGGSEKASARAKRTAMGG